MKTSVPFLAPLILLFASSTLAPANPKPGEERVIAGVRFCWIPGGSFTMGSPPDEADRGANEDQVEVQLEGFWMSKYEVTQGEWKAVMGLNLSHFKGDKLPVERVDWEEARTYAEKVGGRLEGEFARKLWQVRLPTEAEWEYGCRGGTATAFYWGDSASSDKANLNGNRPYGGAAKGDHLEKTTEVGSYERAAPHPWGLCDMHGNVAEWCLDGYKAKLTGGKEPFISPGRGTFGVFRGGSYCSGGRFCRAAVRFWMAPWKWSHDLGVRLVLSPVKR